MKPKVLFFTPYGSWDVAALYELILARELSERGLEVQLLCCDALFTDCDVAWDITRPRTKETCHQCIERSVVLHQKLDLKCEWIKQYLKADELERAIVWEQNLKAHELPQACYEEVPLGQWCRYSVQHHLGVSEINCHEAHVEKVYRSYLRSAFLGLDALDNALEYHRPDVAITLSGRYMPHRVFVELAWSRGIRTLTYEQGWAANSVTFWESDLAKGFLETLQGYNHWKEVPLNKEELFHVQSVLTSREFGELSERDEDAKIQAFDEGVIRLRRLGLTLEKPLVTFFVSAEATLLYDEDSEGRIKPIDALQGCIDFFRERKDCELLIRLEPSIDNRRQVSKEFLKEFQADCVRDLPDNAAILWPHDELDSYALLRISERCIMYSSFMAVEAAAKGKPVMVNEPNCFFSHNFTYNFSSEDSVAASLRAFMDWDLQGEEKLKVIALAYRSAFYYFRRRSLAFPPVGKEGAFPQGANIEAFDHHSSESDATFSQVSSALLRGGPIYPRPKQIPDDAEENEFFQAREDL